MSKLLFLNQRALVQTLLKKYIYIYNIKHTYSNQLFVYFYFLTLGIVKDTEKIIISCTIQFKKKLIILSSKWQLSHENIF